MQEFLTRVSGQIAGFFNGLSLGKKIGLVSTAVFIMTVLVGLFFWAGDKTFSPLLSNLSADDAASIVRVLAERHVPYRLDPTGKNISIPPEHIDTMRLELASLGLPQSGTVGYEVFDKQTLGTTSFVQKLNQKRALEGELMRTIGTIKGVKRARVHLALPQKSTFVEDSKKPSASVFVDLLPGTVLTDRQIYGIGNLVGKAVEGMDVQDVVVIDAQGKVLSKNTNDSTSLANATQLEFKQRYEQELEKRIEEMLFRVVGDGKAVARVSADLDFSQSSETQTTYDPDGAAVRMSQKDGTNSEGSRPGPVGAPGAAANQPGSVPAPVPVTKNTTNRNNETTQYEVPTTVKRTSRPSGSVKKLSVAVMVDGKVVRVPATATTPASSKTEAWTKENLKEFEAIVASAAGIDRKRGDILEIKNMDFAKEDFDEAQRIMAENERKAYMQNLVMYGVVGLVVVLFFFLVVRPFIKWMTENTMESVESYLPQTIEELEKINRNAPLPGLEEAVPVLSDKIDPEKVEGEMIKEKVITLVESNPHKAALIIRDWMHNNKGKLVVDDKAAAGASKAK